MPTYTLTITDRKLSNDPAKLYPRGKDIVEAFARVAQLEVQRDIWNFKRFRYDWIRPKPTFSRSERAWVGVGDVSDFSITLVNDAANKYGTKYAQYVHLAGRAKSDKLWFEVRDYMGKTLLPKMARALTYDMIKADRGVTIKTVRVT